MIHDFSFTVRDIGSKPAAANLVFFFKCTSAEVETVRVRQAFYSNATGPKACAHGSSSPAENTAPEVPETTHQ